MPKYSFKCPSCNKEGSYYVSVETTEKECSCGSSMTRQMPNISKSIVKEKIDSYTNINVSVDNKEELEERKLDHYWSEIVPRLVQEHPPELCLQEGWIYYDERGHIQIHTKPPHKR